MSAFAPAAPVDVLVLDCAAGSGDQVAVAAGRYETPAGELICFRIGHQVTGYQLWLTREQALAVSDLLRTEAESRLVVSHTAAV